MPTLQRRYSITGQTPLDNVPGTVAVKSPKLQGLDTSVHPTGCQFCESGHDGHHLEEPEAELLDSPVRTSSKRSATQLPSPTTPSSQKLPTKIARLGLGLGYRHGGFTEPFPSLDITFSPALSSADEVWSSDVDDLFGRGSAGTPDTAPYTLRAPRYLPDSRSTSPSSVLDEELEKSPTTTSIHRAPLPSRPIHARTPTTFTTLPPEIREHIFRFLPDVVVPYPLIYCLSTFANKKQHPLASVSRLIRDEALALFYSQNTWIIKLEFKIMYDAFMEWVVNLGDHARSLRTVHIAVRGSLFKPATRHHRTAPPAPGFPGGSGDFSPPDGDASFQIDLSEKFEGGKVEILRNDGAAEAGERARTKLRQLVRELWDRRKEGALNGQHWVTMVDELLAFVGCRLEGR